MFSTGEIVLVRKGALTYEKTELSTPDREMNRLIAERTNEAMGVTKAQREAMLGGMLLGWDKPAADPNRYDPSGNSVSYTHLTPRTTSCPLPAVPEIIEPR